ncbi:MAG TPA: hypothetical protein VL261_00620 [Nitrospira sp.]|jgi:hypothetical protein|nr:hypothetical protein [Nitrospira sp.]
MNSSSKKLADYSGRPSSAKDFRVIVESGEDVLESRPMFRLSVVWLRGCSISLALITLSSASAADVITIRDILDEPAIYHLKQVALSGTVRNVQPLDPYRLPAGTTCYGAYLFSLEDETASINVAVFGICGFPTVKDPDVEEGARVEVLATIQAPSHGGYYLSFQGLKVAGEREGIVQAVADRITPLTEQSVVQ